MSHNWDYMDNDVTQMITCHPNYKDPFVRAHSFILRGDGPLSYPTRQYIAIMASARHQCTYLVNMSRNEFISSGGDPQWLQGLDHIPQKLKDLNQINKLLAHQPWLISRSHIEKLTKGSDSWSLSELVHAIVILSHFHALSSFVFGCNIGADSGDNKENGHTNNHPVVVNNTTNTNKPPSPSSLGGSPTTGPEVEALMKTLQTINEQKNVVVAAAEDTASQEDLLKNFEKLEYDSQEQQHSPLFVANNAGTGGSAPVGNNQITNRNGTNSNGANNTSNNNNNNNNSNNSNAVGTTVEANTVSASGGQEQQQQHEDKSLSELNKFMDDPHFGYEDFARRREADFPTFRVQDYSWDDHGFSLVNRLYSDIGNLLDEKFKVCYNLTYFTMGNKTNIDTTPFRRAIWNYIQSMYGIRHDDYDYREVNLLVERNLKAYIKSLCCYPHRVRHNREFNKVMRGFRTSEKIHVNLMVFEARLQAELLYALRAVMRHMT
ncbi:sestrin-3-like [Oppia nitens]|uniref:sestrin-3-like n=1 Tax=Oppia nitens TaxID=1686743 RepID=UPI0023D97D98|nr:sestrin-3-like [Oppia nitens]